MYKDIYRLRIETKITVAIRESEGIHSCVKMHSEERRKREREYGTLSTTLLPHIHYMRF